MEDLYVAIVYVTIAYLVAAIVWLIGGTIHDYFSKEK